MTLQPPAHLLTPLPETAVDYLATLHTKYVDTVAGFAKMVEKAEPAFRPVAEDFLALHARHADTLARMLVAHGRDPDRDGTFMAAVNIAVVALRAFFDNIDVGVMTAIRDGEDRILTASDAALMQPIGAADTGEITEMRDELRTLLSPGVRVG